MEFSWSKRLMRLPPYLFFEIDKKKQELRKKGVKLIDLSIGDPDISAPLGVVNALCRASRIKDNQKYALDKGKERLRKAIKKWMRRRFQVKVSVDDILPVIGSKEGLVHFPLAFVNPGDYVIIPSPGYPGYRGAAVFSGAKIYELPLEEKNHFLPDLSSIPVSIRNKAKIIYLNYPNNPTTVLAPESFLKEVVRFCRKYGIIIVYDNAYSEIYYEEKPLSILEIQGAQDVVIEFHSFSKTFCMTGFRFGWAVGNSKLVAGLLKVKTNIDSGIFGAIQDAGVVALEKELRFVRDLRMKFKRRRKLFIQKIKSIGIEKVYSEATFYVWARIPATFRSSIEFSRYLLEEKNIVATSGIGFGKYGEGFVRFALTVDDKILSNLFER